MRVERHAEQCPECRRLLADLRRMLGALHRLPCPTGGAEVVQIAAAVRRRLEEPPGF